MMTTSNQKFVPKSWGYELWIENNKDYCCKHLHVVSDKWCSFHYHKNKKETFYVIKGELLLIHTPYSKEIEKSILARANPRWDWENRYKEKSDLYYEFNTEVLKVGDSLTIDTGILHSFKSNLPSACDFIESSTFHEDCDSYRIFRD